MEVGASKERVQGLQEALKAGKLHLRGDFKVIFFSVQYELILINHNIGTRLEKNLCAGLMGMLTELVVLPSIDKYARPMYGARKLKARNVCTEMDVISQVIQSQLIELQYCCPSRVSIPLGLLSLETYADCLFL